MDRAERPSAGSDGGLEDGSVLAFAQRLDEVAEQLQRSKLLLSAVPALATRLFGRNAAAAEDGSPLTPAQALLAANFLRLVCDLSLLAHDEADATEQGKPAPKPSCPREHPMHHDINAESSAADIHNAIEEMNGSTLDGRTLNVNEARERNSRGGGGGGGGRGRW